MGSRKRSPARRNVLGSLRALERRPCEASNRYLLPAFVAAVCYRPRGSVVCVSAESSRVDSAGKSGVGPFHLNCSTSSKRGISVRSVANVRNNSALSRSRANVSESALGLAAFTPHSRQSAGMDSRWLNFARTAAVDLAPQPGNPGYPSRRVADQCQIILAIDAGITPNFSHNAGLVAYDASSPIQLHNARAAHALRKVFIGCADQHALDTPVALRRRSARRERVVSLEFHHRPNGDDSRQEDLFQQRKLGEKIGFDAFTGLVTRPQSVTKRLDNVIGSNRHVSSAVLDHPQHRPEDASHRAYLMASGAIPCRGNRVVVPEQLVSTVDQMDDQNAPPPQPYPPPLI